MLDTLPSTPALGDFGQLTLIEPLLRKKQAASILGISIRSVELLIGGGALKAVRVGGSVRIAPEDLRKYIAEAKTAAPARRVNVDQYNPAVSRKVQAQRS